MGLCCLPPQLQQQSWLGQQASALTLLCLAQEKESEDKVGRPTTTLGSGSLPPSRLPTAGRKGKGPSVADLMGDEGEEG